MFITRIKSRRWNINRAGLQAAHKSYLIFELLKIADHRSKREIVHMITPSKAPAYSQKNTIHKRIHDDKASPGQLEFSRLRLFRSIRKHPSEQPTSTLLTNNNRFVIASASQSLVRRSVTAICDVLNRTGSVTYLTKEVLVIGQKLNIFV
jgi:hypothetical protein